nr:MAG TPA: hypothetical protein [Caudoviricetes sp.]
MPLIVDDKTSTSANSTAFDINEVGVLRFITPAVLFVTAMSCPKLVRSL